MVNTRLSYIDPLLQCKQESGFYRPLATSSYFHFCNSRNKSIRLYVHYSTYSRIQEALLTRKTKLNRKMKYFRHGLTELLSETLLPGAIFNSVKVINILKTPGYEQTFLRKPTMPYSIICKHTIARTAITQVQRRGPSRRLGGFLAVSVLGGPFFTTSQSAEACTQTHVWLAQIHSLVVKI